MDTRLYEKSFVKLGESELRRIWLTAEMGVTGLLTAVSFTVLTGISVS